jgi:hypothetical protein
VNVVNVSLHQDQFPQVMAAGEYRLNYKMMLDKEESRFVKIVIMVTIESNVRDSYG